MRGLIAFAIFLTLQPAKACFQPSASELRDFFEEASLWTEVEAADQMILAKQRPVFLSIDFNNPSATEIRWGDNLISGDSLSLCWKTEGKKKIEIRKGFFKTTLIKVQPGLLKSWIPIDGDLFYRKDAEVNKPLKKRELAEDD